MRGLGAASGGVGGRKDDPNGRRTHLYPDIFPSLGNDRQEQGKTDIIEPKTRLKFLFLFIYFSLTLKGQQH